MRMCKCVCLIWQCGPKGPPRTPHSASLPSHEEVRPSCDKLNKESIAIDLSALFMAYVKIGSMLHHRITANMTRQPYRTRFVKS